MLHSMRELIFLQSLALAIRDSQAINKTETLEAVLHTMNDSDLYVSVGGPVIEALINEYGKIGSFSDAKRVFDIVKGPTNGRCLRAMLHACGTAHPRPMWEEVRSRNIGKHLSSGGLKG